MRSFDRALLSLRRDVLWGTRSSRRLELVSSYMVWGDSKDENLIKSRRYYNSAKALEELDVKNIIEMEKKINLLDFKEC
ncbi:hypothetical protein ACRS52_12380 [Bacillus cytotoxicus]|uniref:Uncharacterized protein n=1 Tax=Bacillus cytotoxicus TaxID=580165 RepID=A0AAX2CFS5_9BACI|nr:MULTISPECIES: hypothetical protein [Bacillus cereus group]QTR77722.1 hypothetical protein JC773_14280 [Bacillus cytotoxicus]QTR82458.1 hypothetical protein JC777_18470 [Bacillus cytotoxicus]QTR86196.1 hypothetical protein JC774_16975 [Bacillus cytotoxicus]SCL90309.1 Protein of unknown function [Bacillus cytotoxicus]HDR4571519.1 hypothetical protein [Bacillus cytotoxicus]